MAAALGELPDGCLRRILSFLPANERHAAAARVAPRWREQCVLLALRARTRVHHPPPLEMPASVAARVRAAQERIDPEAAPEAWGALGLGARPFDPACRVLSGRPVPTLEVSSAKDVAKFQREFAGQAPVLITGLAGHWPATQRWTFEQLWRDAAAPGAGRLRVGDDDETSQPVRLAMRDYLQYLVAQTHDDPLYLFDEDFGVECPQMLDEYTVPAALFADDVLPLYASLNDGGSGGAADTELEPEREPELEPPQKCKKQPLNDDGSGGGEESGGHTEPDDPQQQCGEKQLRPRSRKWLLIGPRGSGTDVHTDPDGTSAWNSVVHGCKRWAFIDPCVPEAEVLGPKSHYVEHLPARSWFETTLPQLAEKYPEHVQEALQPPGSMIYIPEGCWHAVWNVEDTVAVTHNSISRLTFDKEWLGCRQRLAVKFPELAEDEAEQKIVRRIDRHFGFEDVPSTLNWCRLLLRGDDDGQTQHRAAPQGAALCHVQRLRIDYE